MDILLNELSIDGQFSSEEEFVFWLKDKLIDVLQLIQENGFFLLKKSDVYNCKITPDKTLGEILYQTNNPLITVLKVYISQLCAQEPYWDMDAATDIEAEYQYGDKYEEPNCFTEAIERRGAVLSFPHESFADATFSCAKNGEQIMVDNIQDIATFLTTCLKMQTLNIAYILEKYPYEQTVSLVNVDHKCYAKEALESNDLTIDDFQNIVRHIAIMIDDLRAGRKTRFWDSFEGGLFEFRDNISAGRIFRLFFCQDGGIQFLNGFVKKTQDTPQQEKTKARNIMKRIKQSGGFLS